MGDSESEKKTKKAEKQKPGPVADRGAPPARFKKRYLKSPERPRILNYEDINGKSTIITLAIGTAKGVDKDITGYIPGLNTSRFEIFWADASTAKAEVYWPISNVRQFATALVGQ